MENIRPDFRKSLSVLRSEWENCTRCDLGARRNATEGAHFVFGEGVERGILFVGEGPGKNEEAEGRPFVGMSGRLLRNAIQKLGIRRHYITNAVSCRSCGVLYDGEGNPLVDYRTKEYRIGDQAPTPAQVESCRPRLLQEIYLVDPVLIVALGSEAAEALARTKVSILEDSGKTFTIRIPGAGYLPSFTEKKKVWARKIAGQLERPVVPNEVEYLMMPILHPAFVARKASDNRPGNPVQVFAQCMKTAAAIYERYMFELYGERAEIGEFTEDDVHEALE